MVKYLLCSQKNHFIQCFNLFATSLCKGHGATRSAALFRANNTFCTITFGSTFDDHSSPKMVKNIGLDLFRASVHSRILEPGWYFYDGPPKISVRRMFEYVLQLVEWDNNTPVQKRERVLLRISQKACLNMLHQCGKSVTHWKENTSQQLFGLWNTPTTKHHTPFNQEWRVFGSRF